MKACYINELGNLLAEQALTRKAMWQPNAADDCPVWHPATPDAFDTDDLDSEFSWATSEESESETDKAQTQT